jgi:hypothetical protein
MQLDAARSHPRRFRQKLKEKMKHLGRLDVNLTLARMTEWRCWDAGLPSSSLANAPTELYVLSMDRGHPSRLAQVRCRSGRGSELDG